MCRSFAHSPIVRFANCIERHSAHRATKQPTEIVHKRRSELGCAESSARFSPVLVSARTESAKQRGLNFGAKFLPSISNNNNNANQFPPTLKFKLLCRPTCQVLPGNLPLLLLLRFLLDCSSSCLSNCSLVAGSRSRLSWARPPADHREASSPLSAPLTLIVPALHLAVDCGEGRIRLQQFAPSGLTMQQVAAVAPEQVVSTTMAIRMLKQRVNYGTRCSVLETLSAPTV